MCNSYAQFWHWERKGFLKEQHPAGGDVEDTKDRTKQKACLERYRKACIEILGVLNKSAPQVGPTPKCERG